MRDIVTELALSLQPLDRFGVGGAGTSPVSDKAEEDIEEFGFCFYRLVGLQ